MQRNIFTALLFFTTIVTASFVSGASRDMQSMNYEGDWQLVSAVQNSIVLEIPSKHTITLKLEAQPDDANIYRASMKVANVMMSSFKITGSNGGNEETIEAGPVASTRMMPPPDLEPLEFFISDYFPQLDTIKVESNILTMEGGGAEIKWEKPDDYDDAA